jgi:hypothetical protein
MTSSLSAPHRRQLPGSTRAVARAMKSRRRWGKIDNIPLAIDNS